MAENERRRDNRLPVMLDIELRRGGWTTYSTEDVSRRGIFIRMATKCPVGQLLQMRLHLPGGDAPLEMMARVARRVSLDEALQGSRLPGVGLEFYCLSNRVVSDWEDFIRRVSRIAATLDHPSSCTVTRVLESTEEASADSLPAASKRQTAHNGQADRPNLIFRPYTMERMQRFLTNELLKNTFNLFLPYHIDNNSKVNLRVIHPRTDEEFVIEGFITQRKKGDYFIDFVNTGESIAPRFRAFMSTGSAHQQQESYQ